MFRAMFKAMFKAINKVLLNRDPEHDAAPADILKQTDKITQKVCSI